MNNVRAALVVIALIACSLLAINWALADSEQPAPKAAASVRVATCDVVEVFNDSKRAADLQKEFAKRNVEFRKQRELDEKAFLVAQAVLTELKEGTEDFENQLKKIQSLAIRFRLEREVEQIALDRDRYIRTRQLYNQVMETVAKVAKSRSIDIVLHQQRQELIGKNLQDLRERIENRKVIYSNKKVDLTSVVLKELNAAYKKSKK